MYKHASIQKMINSTIFKNLLSDAIKFPELFHEGPPPRDADDATNPPHKPRFSGVTICVLLGAVRLAITYSCAVSPIASAPWRH